MHSGNVVRHILILLNRMCIPGLIHLNGQRDPDYAALADLAAYLNRPLHLVYQFFDNRHTKPNTVIVGSRVLMLLRERLENMLLKVLPNADSRIFYDKMAVGNPVLEGGFLCPDKYSAMGTVILERVVNHIHQDLFQVQRISDHPAVLYAGCFQLQTNPTFLRHRG